MPVRWLRAGCPPGERLAGEVGVLAGRLATHLRDAFPDADGVLAESLRFLESSWETAAEGQSLRDFSNRQRIRQGAHRHPLDRLAEGFALSPVELDLLLLAGMPEQHEGFAQVFHTLHHAGQPRPSAGLAAQLLCGDTLQRGELLALLETGPAVRAGVLRVEGEAPLYLRSLRLADRLWPVLHGIDAWPERIERLREPVSLHGLEEWLDTSAATSARRTLECGRAVTVLVTDDDLQVAFSRGAALAEACGTPAVPIQVAANIGGDVEQLIQVHCLARGVIPVLRMVSGPGPDVATVPDFDPFPSPVIACAREGTVAVRGRRALVGVTCERLRPSALVRMWTETLPRLAGDAPLLAARYPLEPAAARQVANDVDLEATLPGRHELLQAVSAAVRSRATAALHGSVQLIRPAANWDRLVLPADRLRQLREAVDRLAYQPRVLDEWRLLEGLRGTRGVRMLFAGPPGTGKTLAAEVLAEALRVDLLMVDLSRVVSKWIGETEKNLADVFETAERCRAVLLFDEADALFGKRTDVSDAHDRYANLETAYLLSRLERFEGLAILSTNLRQNIDPAFTRRLEFVVEFDQPDREQRLALWKCHLPQTAPLADDVQLEALAATYPLVGGLIRNAAVAAAFLAAAEGTAIGRRHLVRAIRREYQKNGRAFPGPPAGMTEEGEP